MDRAKSTLEQWRILQAVVDQGGYAQAAQHLNKSQSSLNHAVSKLQQQLGIQLLEVKGRKAHLTPQGELMLRRSRQVTLAVSELEQLASNLEQGWEPSLTLARDIVYPTPTLTRALKAFHPLSRGTRVTLLDSVLTGTNDLIRNKQVDMALCGLPPKGFYGEPLCYEDLILVCPPKHPLACTKIIHDDRVLTEHLQIVIKDSGSNPQKDFGWLKAEQRWTVSNFHEAITILKQGVGFCWIPKSLVSESLLSGELVRLNLQGGSSKRVHLTLVVPNRDQQGPASKLLESLILKEHGILTDEIEECVEKATILAMPS